jgi:hypothetical protein
VFSRTAARRPLNRSSSTMARIIYDRTAGFAARALLEGTRASRHSCTVAQPTCGCPSVSHGGTAPTKGVRGIRPTQVRAAVRAWTFRLATSRPRLSERNVLLRPEEACHHCRAGCIVPGRARFASSLRGPLAARDDAES